MKQPIAIIIARGGSKRLPRKNVLPFCGRPLMEWSILQAINSRCLEPDRVYLSTDDDEIAEIGKRNGIRIIRRPRIGDPAALSGGYWFSHAVKTVLKKRHFDLFFDILPTSPLRFPDDMDRAYARYLELKPLYPNCQEITWSVPLKEVFIHKYLGAGQLMYYMRNKKYWYGSQGVSANLSEPAFYLEREKDNVSDQAPDNSDIWQDPNGPGRVRYYVQGRWFQQFEIDIQEEFEFCEILMERYILKGRGAKIYTDYRDGAT